MTCVKLAGFLLALAGKPPLDSRIAIGVADFEGDIVPSTQQADKAA